MRFQVSVEAAEITDELLDVHTDQWSPALLGGEYTDVISATDGEGEPETRQLGIVGCDDDVGSRVVDVFVDGVGARHAQGCREPEIDRVDADDAGHQSLQVRPSPSDLRRW